MSLSRFAAIVLESDLLKVMHRLMQHVLGLNTVLVAPVTVGAGAYTVAGSTITDDVPEDVLSIGRARRVDKKSRAAAIRREKLAEEERRQRQQQKGQG
jgi:bifunctional UDP-N-acetylglucosamine pyrophosphorylase/glucosamine-1-phosphate N-acetyltransferase